MCVADLMSSWSSAPGASTNLRLLNDFFWANQTNPSTSQNDNARDLVPPYFQEVDRKDPGTGKYWNFNDFWVGGHGVYDYEYVPLPVPGEERGGGSSRRLNQQTSGSVQYNLNNCAKTTNGQSNYQGCMGVCQALCCLNPLCRLAQLHEYEESSVISNEDGFTYHCLLVEDAQIQSNSDIGACGFHYSDNSVVQQNASNPYSDVARQQACAAITGEVFGLTSSQFNTLSQCTQPASPPDSPLSLSSPPPSPPSAPSSVSCQCFCGDYEESVSCPLAQLPASNPCPECCANNNCYSVSATDPAGKPKAKAKPKTKGTSGPHHKSSKPGPSAAVKKNKNRRAGPDPAKVKKSPSKQKDVLTFPSSSDPSGLLWNADERAVMHIGNYKITCNAFGNCTSIGDYYDSCNKDGTQSSALTEVMSGTPFCTAFSYSNVVTMDGQFSCSAGCTDVSNGGCQCSWSCQAVPGSYAAENSCGNPWECSASASESNQSNCATQFDHACPAGQEGAKIVSTICYYFPLEAQSLCQSWNDYSNCCNGGC